MNNKEICMRLSKILNEIESSNKNLLLHHARAKVIGEKIDISYVSWQSDNVTIDQNEAKKYLDYLEKLESTRKFKPHYFVL